MKKTQRKIKSRLPKVQNPVNIPKRSDVVIVPANNSLSRNPNRHQKEWSPKFLNTRTTSPGRAQLCPESLFMPMDAENTMSRMSTRRPIVMVPIENSAINRSCFTTFDKTDFGQTTERGVDIEISTHQESKKVMFGECFAAIHNTDFGQTTEEAEEVTGHSISEGLCESQGVDPLGLAWSPLARHTHELYINRETSPVLFKDFNVTHELPGVNEFELKSAISGESGQWHTVDKEKDIEMIFNHLSKEFIPVVSHHCSPKDVAISSKPRIKKIADRFSKFKTSNNIELRRLEEKIVCVEYEVFDKSDVDKPIQIMRTFFSIKPPNADVNEAVKEVPSDIKAKLNVNDENTFTEQEIEIIDAKIHENRPYLDGLRAIIKRNKNRNTKRDSPDLRSLYEIAKRQRQWIDTDFDANVLTKAELAEIKDMILQKCPSHIHGVCRKKIGMPPQTSEILSDSLVAVMLKESFIKT